MYGLKVSSEGGRRKWQCSVAFFHRDGRPFIKIGLHTAHFEFFSEFLANGWAGSENVSGGNERKFSFH